ncbi:endothelin-converting enzyme 1-like [Pseudomyrmex gracilis]|uniref:endothelin-converting enzyme 1-like n=1 Tax=Pseudomyrmex gracilis TaxID=219809 RepID=UPI00099531B4|nr:endothelin-converting enzyme 1-like [Pseudomyrmex gracilis]
MPYRNWDDEHLWWQIVSSALLKNGFQNGLFNIKVVPDVRNSTGNVIFISDPVFFFSRDDMIQLSVNEIQKKMYINIITTFALHLIEETNGTVDMDTLIRDIEDMIEFEIKLANLTMSYQPYANVNQISRPLTIYQLQVEYLKEVDHLTPKGMIDWLDTIQSVFASEGIVIGYFEKLVVQAYDYILQLVPLLQQTPSRTIVNHMIWNSIQRFYFRDTKNLKPSNNKIDNRWKMCITQSNLKHAILHEYVKKYLSKNTIQDITSILTNVKNAIREQIENSAWMDEPIRETYLERLTYMKHEFIMPEWYNDEAIDRYYENVSISTNYLDTAIQLYQFERKKMIRSLRTPDITLEWDVDLTTDTYYNSGPEKTVVPATVLQTPIYDSNIPFLNYGTLGFLSGHRINYDLVDNHVKYNSNGRVVSLITTQKSINEFRKIINCAADQYSKYPYPGLEDKYVHGRVTVKESIIDFASLSAAYYAYKNKQVRQNDYEWRMQGLEEYSDDQIFFITYAQMMCENVPSKMIEMHRKIIYTTNEIRIRGSLSNFPAFSAAYKCPVGKPMNPEKKCTFWE